MLTMAQAIFMALQQYEKMFKKPPTTVELSLDEMGWLAEELQTPHGIPTEFNGIPIVMVEDNRYDAYRKTNELRVPLIYFLKANDATPNRNHLGRVRPDDVDLN